MKKIEHTKMMNRYMLKLLLRMTIFVIVLVTYIYDRNILHEAMTYNIYRGVRPIHLLWFYFMTLMFLHLFPVDILSMALKKEKQANFVPVEGYSELELLKYVQQQNRRAWKVLLVWLCINAGFGLLYLCGIIGDGDLLMLTVFFFLCDYICILFFCPFQSYIMKNQCCINCRIYDWGHFMMFTPMLFIKNFFSWSLFFMSVVVMIHWELIYAKHPERFWQGSNQTLRCANCKDKTCQIKGKVL